MTIAQERQNAKTLKRAERTGAMCRSCRRPVMFDPMNGRPADHSDYCIGLEHCHRSHRAYRDPS